MLKKITILALIVVISGSAAYSFHALKFVDKVGMVFQEAGPRQQRGQSGRPGGHGAHSISFLEGLLQIGAYFSVFAFVVMVTYYAERLLRKKPLMEKKHSVPLQGEYCKSE